MFPGVKHPSAVTATDVERMALPGKQVGLAAGTQLVWLVDPERREIRIYRQDGSLTVLRENDSLDGENVLPGFTCPVAHLFA